MIFVRLQYSLDGGTTWLPASPGHVDLVAQLYSCIVIPERVIEQKFQAAGRKRVVDKGRVKLTLSFLEDQFTTTADPSNVKFLYLQAWIRRPLLRIWTHDGAASPSGVNVDSYSYFASATNTNYLIPDDGLEPEIRTSMLRSFEVVLESRDWID